MPSARTPIVDALERAQSIPSIPEVASQVFRLVNDPNSNVKQVTAAMARDTALAAKALRMANSVYYGLNEPVHDLEQAIAVLGLKTIRSIVMSVSVLNLYQQQNADFNMKAFWAHSAASACLCRLIAAQAKVCDAEFAFTLGLLKDIGKLLIAEHAPDECRTIIAAARQRRLSFTQAAREVMGSDDAETGAWLCERWELGPQLTEAIRNQFNLAKTTEPKLVAVCQLAEYLCMLKRIRTPGSCDEPKLDPAVWPHLGLDKTKLVEVLTLINDEIDNARQLLTLARQ